MHTPWGDLAVADAHVHFFSHRFFSLLAHQRGKGGVGEAGQMLGWEMPPEDPVELAGRWVAELDRHGVSRAAVIASLPGDERSVLAAAAAYPSRFHGYFMIDPMAHRAVETAERVLAGEHTLGICLFPAMHRYSLHEDRVLALCRLASERPGTVVFVHCGVLSVGVRAKLGLPSPFDMRFSNPVDVHALAMRFPETPFVIPHFGAGYLREALMVVDLCPNVYLDTSSSNRWTRYYTPALELRDVFARALDVAGPRRLLFGTDSSFFPRGWQKPIFDQQVEILHGLGVSAGDAAAILGGNLTTLSARP
jgi:uncharacterized protein